MLADKILICYDVSNVQRSLLVLSPARAFVKDSVNSIPVAATWLLIHNMDDKVFVPLMESQTGGLDGWGSWRIRWKSRSWDCLLQRSRERDSCQELFWSRERKRKLMKFTGHLIQTELILPNKRSWVDAKIVDIEHVTKQFKSQFQIFGEFTECFLHMPGLSTYLLRSEKSIKDLKSQNKPTVLLHKPVWNTFTKIFSRRTH